MVFDGSILAAAGTALIGLCSITAVGSIGTRINHGDAKKQDTFEDADGKATPESVKAYSAKLPKSLVLLSAGAGCGISIALLVLSPRAEGRLLINSLGTGAWVSQDVASSSSVVGRILIFSRVFCCSKLWL